VHAAGGPSAPWFYKLKDVTGPVSVRHVPFLDALDGALRWKPGTSLGLVSEDRADWAPEVLADEEDALVATEDEMEMFAWIVAQRLRLMTPEHRDRVMRDIAHLIGLPSLPS